MDSIKKTIVSVITVARNSEKTIKNTIESVLKQDFVNYEYIVIDGASEDSTYSIVCEYDQKFKDKGVKYFHKTEKDNGIFDAMNKGIELSSGQWINFMNSDDRFHSNFVLSSLFNADILNSYDTYDVIYGDTIRIADNKIEFGKSKHIDMIKLNMPFCHQSSFTTQRLMKNYKFDLAYRVADYNFFLRLYLKGGKFLQKDIIISDYSMEGFSNKNKYKTYLGTIDIKHDLGLINKNSLKQKFKNIYFYCLLKDRGFFHGIISKIDSRMSRRAKE